MNALNLVLVAALTAQAPLAVESVDTTSVKHPITTANPVAQQHFDRGLELVFASRNEEAVKAFVTAQRIDPSCAMCYWGEALALGPGSNRVMRAAEDSAAQAAMKKATLHARRVSSHERAYIRALARRYGSSAVATRQARDTAYAKAMGEIVRAFPGDSVAVRLHEAAKLLLARGSQVGAAADERFRPAPRLPEPRRTLPTEENGLGAPRPNRQG